MPPSLTGMRPQPRWLTSNYATAARIRTSPPPEPLPYKSIPRKPPIHQESQQVEAAPENSTRWSARILPSRPQDPIYPPSPDPARGLEAARQVVQQGVLHPRYKRAARNYTAIIVALPIALYTSYELLQRRFGGKEQKKRIALPTPDEG